MTSFLRVIKFALQDMARNASLSFMTFLILVLMLLSINTIIVIRILTAQATMAVKDQIDLSIFFDRAATDKQIADVRKHIASFPEVSGMAYQSRDDVLARFKAAHAQSPEILSSLDELGDNPFGPTLIIKARDPNDYQKIVATLRVPEYEHIIQAKTFADTEKAINRIQVITTHVEKFILVLSALFALIAFLIIFNTVRVAIYTQRAEIGIKKLVGATNWFIRGPYLIESFFFAIASVAMGMALVFAAVRVLDPYVSVIFQAPSFLTGYFSSHILTLVAAQFAAVFALTCATSLLAMRKYLKV